MREIKFTVRYECEETMPELDKKIIKALEGIRGCKAQYEICRTMPQPLQTVDLVVDEKIFILLYNLNK